MGLKPLGQDHTVPFYRPTDGESHPYVDLREEPEKIDDIPEAKDFPELKEFLRDINGSDSFFRTLACITIPNEIQDSELPYETRSYIDITFIPWEWGSSAVNSFVVFYDFTKFMNELDISEKPEALANVRVFLNLKTSKQIDLNISFWAMEWWIMSLGKTSEEAREGWKITLNFLRRLLLQISPQTKERYDQMKIASAASATPGQG